MSNDELQKAIDDITSGDAVADAETTSSSSTTNAGTASVPLPDELVSAESPTETKLDFTETPDSSAGASADIFGVPPTPDTSTAMPAGTSDPATNPAMEAAPALDENVFNPDPLAGFDPDGDSLGATNDTTTAPTAPDSTKDEISAFKAPVEDTRVATEMPTTDTLDEKTPESPAETNNIVDEAMKELYPLLDKVPSLSDKEKFDVCMKVGGEALPKALQYAKEISDEAEKAEALMKIIESAK